MSIVTNQPEMLTSVPSTSNARLLEVTPAVRQPNTAPIPTLRAVTVTPVDGPANQYA
jgi:hypothetical protein